MKTRNHNRRTGIKAAFSFTVRSEPLPAELRPAWRIALLLLMLRRVGRSGAMSLKKAHLVCSGASSKASRERLLRLLNGNRHLEDVPLRIDPSLNRAIDYAIAERLIAAHVRSETCVLELLPSGTKFVEALMSESECLVEEKLFAESLRGNVPNERVEEILNWETTL